MSDANFTYQRKDGGTTLCYGTVQEDSNFDIVCANEFNDGVWTDNENFTTWRQVCVYLEKNYNARIEQLEAI